MLQLCTLLYSTVSAKNLLIDQQVYFYPACGCLSTMTSTLCVACREIFEHSLCFYTKDYPHHHTMQELRTSSKDCAICSILWLDILAWAQRIHTQQIATTLETRERPGLRRVLTRHQKVLEPRRTSAESHYADPSSESILKTCHAIPFSLYKLEMCDVGISYGLSLREEYRMIFTLHVGGGASLTPTFVFVPHESFAYESTICKYFPPY